MRRITSWAPLLPATAVSQSVVLLSRACELAMWTASAACKNVRAAVIAPIASLVAPLFASTVRPAAAAVASVCRQFVAGNVMALKSALMLLRKALAPLALAARPLLRHAAPVARAVSHVGKLTVLGMRLPWQVTPAPGLPPASPLSMISPMWTMLPLFAFRSPPAPLSGYVPVPG